MKEISPVIDWKMRSNNMIVALFAILLIGLATLSVLFLAMSTIPATATTVEEPTTKTGADTEQKLQTPSNNLKEEEYTGYILYFENHEIPRELNTTQTIEYMKKHTNETQENALEILKDHPDIEVVKRLWIDNTITVAIDTTEIDPRELKEIEEVLEVKPIDEIPVPEYTSTQTNLNKNKNQISAKWGVKRVNATKVWKKYNTKGDNVKVAVLDSGVDISHPDISLYKWAEFGYFGTQKNTNPNYGGAHGTHVTGIISGDKNSGEYIGVAPNVRIIHGKIGGRKGPASINAIKSGMQWAVKNGAEVVSMSFGANKCPSKYISRLANTVKNVYSAGTLVVAGSGNGGKGCTATPGNAYEALSVGAINKTNGVWKRSSGEKVSATYFKNPPSNWPSTFIVPDVVAPGYKINSSIPSKFCTSAPCYSEWTGTSMAAPHVSGVAALVISASDGNPPTPQVKKAIIKSGWKPNNCRPSCNRNGKDTRYGAGIIDAKKAVKILKSNGIKGTVTNKNGKSISNAKIRISGGYTETNSNGNYKISLLPGTYTIKVNAKGYKPQKKTVQVKKNTYTKQNIVLKSSKITSCTTITQEGIHEITSNLNGNQDPCIKIEASNVTIKGHGNRLTGPGQGTGIKASNSKKTLQNVVIQNIEVEKWTMGVRYKDVNDGKIQNAQIHHNSYGVIIQKSDNNTIGSSNNKSKKVEFTNNKIVNLGLIRGSDSNKIHKNVFRNGRLGIVLSKSSQNNIVKNKLYKMDSGIKIHSNSNNNTVEFNNVFDTKKTGIKINTNSSYNKLISNYITNKTQGRSGDGISIMSGSKGNLLDFNRIRNQTNGIYIRNSNRIKVKDNGIVNPVNGLFFKNSSKNKNTGNKIFSGERGIFLNTTSNRSDFSYNVVENVSTAIRAENSSYNQFDSFGVVKNVRYEFNSTRGSINNSVTVAKVIPNSWRYPFSKAVRFNATDVRLNAIPNNGTVSPPCGLSGIGKVIPVKGNDYSTESRLLINLSYQQANVSGVKESTVSMYGYNQHRLWWYELSYDINKVNVQHNYVKAEVLFMYGNPSSPYPNPYAPVLIAPMGDKKNSNGNCWWY